MFQSELHVYSPALLSWTCSISLAPGGTPINAVWTIVPIAWKCISWSIAEESMQLLRQQSSSCVALTHSDSLGGKYQLSGVMMSKREPVLLRGLARLCTWRHDHISRCASVTSSDLLGSNRQKLLVAALRRAHAERYSLDVSVSLRLLLPHSSRRSGPLSISFSLKMQQQQQTLYTFGFCFTTRNTRDHSAKKQKKTSGWTFSFGSLSNKHLRCCEANLFFSVSIFLLLLKFK